MQDKLEEDIAQVISNAKLVQHILTEYIPSVLVEKMGLKNIENLLGTAEPQSYRDTIFTKKTCLDGVLQIWDRMGIIHRDVGKRYAHGSVHSHSELRFSALLHKTCNKKHEIMR